MVVRRQARVILTVGLLLGLMLALFPPMRMTLAPENGDFVVLGRTAHMFLFSNFGGGWTIDTGRFVVYAFLLAVVTCAGLALESWSSSDRTQNIIGSTTPVTRGEVRDPSLRSALGFSAVSLAVLLLLYWWQRTLTLPGGGLTGGADDPIGLESLVPIHPGRAKRDGPCARTGSDRPRHAALTCSTPGTRVRG